MERHDNLRYDFLIYRGSRICRSRISETVDAATDVPRVIWMLLSRLQRYSRDKKENSADSGYI